ncbi:DUF3905 domain-containing protein [Desertibacillus haloalkaliphilus]|uniref:DUF3905 domain-containing protein n=1 Tax=Desertibacillus haloalkaliphilus TaxID=1328930 RepID=UPI001C27D460|nr:DUF3905 domain-containing protein [Desertibacillus haloalkaliphilus]MBU8907027.1 DUF3905 domain-containing protein [Desertibacillus haloalkaliphilus]
MKKKRDFDPNPETPLDHWDENIDPALMSGDFWVEMENAPLEQIGWFKSGECDVVKEKVTPPKSLFMHPSINVSYGNDSWTGTRPIKKSTRKEK